MKWRHRLNNDIIVHGVRPGLGYMRPVGSDPTQSVAIRVIRV